MTGYGAEGISTYSETYDGSTTYFAEMNGIAASGETRAKAVSNLRRWVNDRREGIDA